MQPLRKDLSAPFDPVVIPTSAQEEWKYTNLQSMVMKLGLTRTEMHIPDISDMTFFTHDLTPSQTEAPKTVLAKTVTSRPKSLYGFTVPQGERIITPLIIRHTAEEQTYLPDWQVLTLEPNSAFFLIEYFEEGAGSWHNAFAQIKLARDSKLTHIRFFEGKADTIHTVTTHALLAENANYKQISLTTSAGLLRQENHIELQGEHAEVTIGGIIALHGKDHVDNTILIEHKAENCRSNQHFKYLLNDESKGVFQGKVHVHKQAQKTDGFQRCNTILLSPDAVMNTKPELEIYADDVKCSHGTTTGELDETPLFYLRSRGLPEKDARRLLLQAFIGEVLELVDDENTRTEMEAKVTDALL
ncbi:MAG: Fe-S cluster assembly protein SufD [Alphaproteobacteria bacterium]|nr:Fe-S cluster assembly protein SufD [Alphaproteobacteria bacterium]